MFKDRGHGLVGFVCMGWRLILSVSCSFSVLTICRLSGSLVFVGLPQLLHVQLVGVREFGHVFGICRHRGRPEEGVLQKMSRKESAG